MSQQKIYISRYLLKVKIKQLHVKKCNSKMKAANGVISRCCQRILRRQLKRLTLVVSACVEINVNLIYS